LSRRVSSSFAVVLLLLVSCNRPNEAVEGSEKLVAKTSQRQVRFYFERADALLAPEVRTLTLPEDAVASLTPMLREYLKGPASPDAGRPFPPDSILRAAYVLPDGTAIIDIGGPTLASGWTTGSHAELMGAQAMVQTVVHHVPQVQRVRILVNGQPAETLAGHVRLDRPLTPIGSLVRG
jgi:spore germination protein GerM